MYLQFEKSSFAVNRNTRKLVEIVKMEKKILVYCYKTTFDRNTIFSFVSGRKNSPHKKVLRYKTIPEASVVEYTMALWRQRRVQRIRGLYGNIDRL